MGICWKKVDHLDGIKSITAFEFSPEGRCSLSTEYPCGMGGRDAFGAISEKVEARGVEPLSSKLSTQAFTCLSDVKF